MADISVATMDINGLKVTNDSFGHTAGDELIQAAANIMKEIGSLAGRETISVITNMDEPVGYAVGNTLEIIETVCLKI